MFKILNSITIFASVIGAVCFFGCIVMSIVWAFKDDAWAAIYAAQCMLYAICCGLFVFLMHLWFGERL